LIERWRAAWPDALAAWSKYTRLHDARFCHTTVAAAEEGLRGSFAMIRLSDQSVVVDLQSIKELGLEDYAVEILAHEIGHHVLAPGSAADHFRLLARMRRALPTFEQRAAMVANLYTDLMINDRLQRQAGLRMGDIYRKLGQANPRSTSKAPASKLWLLYMRIYENLWKLHKGGLGGGAADEAMDTDAWLGARLVRVYAKDWMDGAGKFATLLLPYLEQEQQEEPRFRPMYDTRDAAENCEPAGGQQIEPGELEDAIHPVNDSRISGLDAPGESESDEAHSNSDGQTREPYEYGEILKSTGVKLSEEEIAVRYYRERALGYLIAFPKMPPPVSREPQMEGLEAWQIGDPLDELDWLQSVLQNPRPIPGLTTVRRSYGPGITKPVKPEPVDLDLYVDSSASMPDPRTETSYLALAGAVVALSALRAGSNVQVTLWSGSHQFMSTDGFVRDEREVLRILTSFYGGMTCFPIHRLRETFASERPRRTHILMISDDGITTMFDKDERGNSGWDIAAQALKMGGAGGTMALNMPAKWEDAGRFNWKRSDYEDLKRARSEQGWDIHAISRVEGLVDFARAFSRRHYAKSAT
jgi:hypothetical protein